MIPTRLPRRALRAGGRARCRCSCPPRQDWLDGSNHVPAPLNAACEGLQTVDELLNDVARRASRCLEGLRERHAWPGTAAVEQLKNFSTTLQEEPVAAGPGSTTSSSASGSPDTVASAAEHSLRLRRRRRTARDGRCRRVTAASNQDAGQEDRRFAGYGAPRRSSGVRRSCRFFGLSGEMRSRILSAPGATMADPAVALARRSSRGAWRRKAGTSRATACTVHYRSRLRRR